MSLNEMWRRAQRSGLMARRTPVLRVLRSRAARRGAIRSAAAWRSIDDWLERTGASGRTSDVPPDVARAGARLGLAVFRGLLLDLVGTGDRAGVDAAFEAYAALAALCSRRLRARDMSIGIGQRRTR